jgi:hypothetical protein
MQQKRNKRSAQTAATTNDQDFSQQLQTWLDGDQPKTVGGLIEISADKSLALVCLVLMAVPALPVPTGGLTHVFEIIVMLLAIEMVVGRQTVWLPARWSKRPLGKALAKHTLPALIKRVAWLEARRSSRWPTLPERGLIHRLTGIFIFGLVVAAFFAPPFTGLDTLPSLGAVGLGLGLVLKDSRIWLLGLLVGALGVVVEIGLGGLLIAAIRRI